MHVFYEILNNVILVYNIFIHQFCVVNSLYLYVVHYNFLNVIKICFTKNIERVIIDVI